LTISKYGHATPKKKTSANEVWMPGQHPDFHFMHSLAENEEAIRTRPLLDGIFVVTGQEAKPRGTRRTESSLPPCSTSGTTL
jgi:hypothetical protein